MSLRDSLSEGRLRRHPANAEEIARLLKVADRALQDAGVLQLSVDWRYITAYNAALALATIAVRASGYRAGGVAHHWTTFAVLPDLLGAQAQDRADYFNNARNKRNRAAYEQAGEICEGESAKLLAEVRAFRAEVLDWLAANHPELLPKQ